MKPRLITRTMLNNIRMSRTSRSTIYRRWQHFASNLPNCTSNTSIRRLINPIWQIAHPNSLFGSLLRPDHAFGRQIGITLGIVEVENQARAFGGRFVLARILEEKCQHAVYVAIPGYRVSRSLDRQIFLVEIDLRSRLSGSINHTIDMNRSYGRECLTQRRDFQAPALNRAWESC